FSLKTTQGDLSCESLVIATGGLSIPKMGASPFGYKMAKQFGIKIIPTTAGLVPFTLHLHDKEKFSLLSGIALDATVSNHRKSFRENILFTHRGLSGPAILQLSSYWQPGEPVFINLAPDHDLLTYLLHAQQQHPQQRLKTTLHHFFPKRLIAVFVNESLANTPLAKIANPGFEEVAKLFHAWRITPNGTEGYRTAEVTVGGVDCNAMSSKTMMATQVPQLYFIGEVLDVTGWLGGYNFQWAWSSGWCAGQYV
ncbi:MAG: aminoacetone oxidase family FAD-binding enzyme, partial [Gammaproteobacteria bacterium]|nr:aminoacetone oxidase family FAD-binding enzyme [Gammaproteobacteria bacterium]